MKTKHTKGPWEFKKGDCWTIFADGESIMGDMQYYPWCPANEADWHLIAAAPTMLEALQEAVACGMVPSSSVSDGGASKYGRQVQVADMIRAAIAKATGEQQ